MRDIVDDKTNKILGHEYDVIYSKNLKEVISQYSQYFDQAISVVSYVKKKLNNKDYDKTSHIWMLQFDYYNNLALEVLYKFKSFNSVDDFEQQYLMIIDHDNNKMNQEFINYFNKSPEKKMIRVNYYKENGVIYAGITVHEYDPNAQIKYDKNYLKQLSQDNFIQNSSNDVSTIPDDISEDGSLDFNMDREKTCCPSQPLYFIHCANMSLSVSKAFYPVNKRERDDAFGSKDSLDRDGFKFCPVNDTTPKCSIL